jgi:hypothetical protein
MGLSTTDYKILKMNGDISTNSTGGDGKGEVNVEFVDGPQLSGGGSDKDKTPKQEKYKNGSYVAVLNDPYEVHGLGHNALMIGNDDEGWDFISKGGRDDHGNSTSDNNSVSGGPSKVPNTKHFNNLNEFLTDPNFKEYSRGLILKIKDPAKGINTMLQEAKNNYNAFTANCAQAVNATLQSLNIPVHPITPTLQFPDANGWVVASLLAPNIMYLDIVKANENVSGTFIVK